MSKLKPNEEQVHSAAGLTRRELLRNGGALAFALITPLGCADSQLPTVAVPIGKEGEGFLGPEEMDTLRAVVDRLIPPDGAPGGAEVGCAEGIDGLLSAFNVNPPRIYAGGPFSDRGGSAENHFAQFLPLDPYEAMAWRLRIEGSQGKPELEFNGPVTGLQEIYRDGIAALNAASGGNFAALPVPAQELILRGNNPAVQAMIDVAFPHSIQFMFGAPEYGGNKDLKGWKFTKFDGDVQPRGYTPEEVTENKSAQDESLPSFEGINWIALAPLAAPEALHGLLARSDGKLSAITAEVQAALRAAEQRHG